MIASYDDSDLPPPCPDGAVVSVGVFDGVHLGHQAILECNLREARRRQARASVVTFRQHPKSVLLGRAPRTLTSLEHRLELFRRAGIDHTWVLTFDEALRDLEAEVFVREMLEPRLDVRAFVLGFDSKFGRGQRGTPAFLGELGYEVTVVPKVDVRERAVSSTAIREAVELGDLEGARAMLGRPVTVLGTVVRGAALGRQLGFPTANLDLHHELHPPNGVYACRARVLPGAEPAGTPLPAVANIGTRPTVAGSADAMPRLEVHLLDFDATRQGGDLYGRSLEVEFVARLREERRFAGLDALRAQIALDVEAAREVL